MLKEDLRVRALSMIQIPAHFQPILEERFEGENGQGEALFSWSDEGQDEGITVNLDLEGNLTGLSLDILAEPVNTVFLNTEERRERAEQFLSLHYPDALESLALCKIQELTRAIRFEFGQVVMGIPLDQSGCFMDVDSAGNIVNFKYYGVKETPGMPTTLISKEVLVEHVKSGLDFQLKITNLYTSMYDVAEDGIRLVYDPIQDCMDYKADVLKPTLMFDHDEDAAQAYVSLTAPSKPIIRTLLSVEEVVGISERMEIIREVDMGEETGIVWRERDWEMTEQDLSVDSFFKRQTEDTVKAFVSKDTGNVRAFAWFKERKGDLQLSHEVCYQKAIDFLQILIPDYCDYLQLIVREKEEEQTLESFIFHMHNGHGIPVQLNMVMVAVNSTTGQIDHYSGPSLSIEKLRQLPTEPAISKDEASEAFINQLDFELAWKKDYDSDTESHLLTYQACSRSSGTAIRYIDAMTGAVISAIDY